MKETPTGTIRFLVDGQQSRLPITLTNGAAMSLPIASLGAGQHTVSAIYSGDDEFASSNTSITVSVDRAPLTVRADDQTKVYGRANPVLTASYEGFVLGEGPSALAVRPTLTTTATAASSVGSYPIEAAGAQASNYEITYLAGSMQVTPAELNVIADDKWMAHGDPVPTLTFVIHGLVNGDPPSVVRGAPVLSTSATSSSPAGYYPIDVALGNLEADNYVFAAPTQGTLTVRPKVVDVRVLWGSRSMSILGLGRDLPFSNIRGLEVIFSDDVSLGREVLTLRSEINPGNVYAVDTFSYEQSTRVARWTLPSAIDVDRLMLALDGDGEAEDGIDGIRAAGGHLPRRLRPRLLGSARRLQRRPRREQPGPCRHPQPDARHQRAHLRLGRRRRQRRGRHPRLQRGRKEDRPDSLKENQNSPVIAKKSEKT